MKRPAIKDLEHHKAYYEYDLPFAASSRLLQSKWREQKGYPIGKRGNYIELEFAKRTKANFLTDKIKKCVSDAIIEARNTGGMIGEPRIWENLLSSQPLCFNLFGEMHFDLELATNFFHTLFPRKVNKVSKVRFEYSPSRGNTSYTGDHSAFDVFIEYLNHQKELGFIGIEVKYAESLREETSRKANDNFKKHSLEYMRLTSDSNVFKTESVENLRLVPIAQIWRDHLLSIATKKDYTDGFFVFLFPSENEGCQKGVDLYQNQLISNNEDETGFYPRHLETFIETLKIVQDTDWVRELKERYLGT
jgi:hypothetical protein